jgi:hypothetical protein
MIKNTTQYVFLIVAKCNKKKISNTNMIPKMSRRTTIVLMLQHFTSPHACVELHSAWCRGRCCRAVWCHDRGCDAMCSGTVAIVMPCGVVIAVTVIMLHVVMVAVVTLCGVATVVAVVMLLDWSAKEGVSRKEKKENIQADGSMQGSVESLTAELHDAHKAAMSDNAEVLHLQFALDAHNAMQTDLA